MTKGREHAREAGRLRVDRCCHRDGRRGRSRERNPVARGRVQPRRPDLGRRRARRGAARADGVDPASVRVDVDGIDVTSAFAVRPTGRYEGLLTGLKLGRNTLTVTAGNAGKRIAITNHPLGGPIFSGPQVTPYFCDPAYGSGPQCEGPTRVELLYRNLAGQFVAYDASVPPAAIQTTTTDSRPHRAVHRRARHRHRQPRRVPDGRARRPVEAGRAVVGGAAVEPQALLHVRRRLRHRAPPAAADERAAGHAARRRLRRRHLEPERLRQQLQRRRLGRGGDDDQGARDRALRRAEVHDGQRRFGGDDAAAPAGRELPGPARRADHEPGVRGPLDPGRRARSTAAC